MALSPKLCVIDDNGRHWPNLVGVFRREFPVAVGHARERLPTSVTYYGDRFRIQLESDPLDAALDACDGDIELTD